MAQQNSTTAPIGSSIYLPIANNCDLQHQTYSFCKSILLMLRVYCNQYKTLYDTININETRILSRPAELAVHAANS
ncbi:MAG: hypothetical protein R2788_14995 [Saprospiraceae bacterium]